MSTDVAAPAVPAPVRMTGDQREAFERDGYIVLPGVLSDAELVRYTAAIDQVYARATRLGEIARDGSLHRLSAVAGQGLSRLLNVSDGLLGEGLRAVVLVTTNEPLRRLHPAVVRPGLS